MCIALVGPSKAERRPSQRMTSHDQRPKPGNVSRCAGVPDRRRRRRTRAFGLALPRRLASNSCATVDGMNTFKMTTTFHAHNLMRAEML
jgi:hypothetical protein